ncbi:MAG: PHP domain-containing protein [Verrucomicrobia bacterium]|nr:PHP domain-containing protein [Verrucomicrobiota bacterium]
MIDLHAHSIFSDGSLTPEELIEQACAAGLRAVALTDHDTTAGLSRFLAAAEGRPVRAIPGVEISADFSPGTMHMLGYFIRPADPALEERLVWIREGRDKRNAEILGKLNALGFSIAWDEVARHAGADVVGRPHFAQVLLERDIVKTKDEAFDRYLGKGKPAYAERRRFSIEDSIALIRAAGGVSVLAHPFTLGLDDARLRLLVERLAGQGLGGLEVYYSEHSSGLQQAYSRLAADFGLVATGGSDFHGALTPDVKLGSGFGGLRVPDEVVEKLEARRPGP